MWNMGCDAMSYGPFPMGGMFYGTKAGMWTVMFVLGVGGHVGHVVGFHVGHRLGVVL